MNERIYYLWFNHDEGRWQRHSRGLHCGEGLTALINGQWVDTRIEHSSSVPQHSGGWYLVTHPALPLFDLPVR